ncbi:hypothetical protein ACGGKE_18295 (plasmid) [Sphingobium naphthae]|uniref:hypothetical protein n=1 Tax=Sphingobium naphthae TaxID=1886786 RepID=UPI00374842B8
MTEMLGRLRGGDLYAVLSLATNEELEPLVKIITAKLTNFLEVKDEYQRHHPNHRRYHALIGDELRLYGGNSLMNLGRGGEGPSYDEIVADVCWKLSVPYEKGRTVENEANLLDIFLEQRWRSLDPAERELLAGAAREAALGKTSEKASYARSGAAALATTLFTGPGLAVLGISLLDPSYKVTVPCALHVAFLRRKFLEEGRAGADEAKRPSTGEIGVAPVDRPDEASTTSLELHDDAGVRLLTIRDVPDIDGRPWSRIGDAEDAGVSRLNSLVQAVPALGTAAEIAGATGTRYMEVVCNGELMKAAKGGGYRAMSRSGTKITEHANLFDADKLSLVANASALMNVASVALAQKHLADISEKLSALKKEVDGVADFQVAGRKAILTSSIRYFEQIAPAVLAGEHSGGVASRIEDCEAKLLEVQDHLAHDFAKTSRELQDLKDMSWFSSSEFVDAIERHQRQLNDLSEQQILCVRARALGWQLLCEFPDGEITKKCRRDDIVASLNELTESGDRLRRMDAALREKLRKASSLWSASAMNSRKLGIMQTGDELLTKLAEESGRIMAGIKESEEARSALQRPFRMRLMIEDGRVAAVQPLEEAAPA